MARHGSQYGPLAGDEVSFFNLPSNISVWVIETRRTAFDKNGAPIRVTVTVYPADKNALVYEEGTTPPIPGPP